MPTSLVDVAATDPHVGFVSCGSYCRFVHLARVTHAMKLFDDEAKKCFLSFFCHRYMSTDAKLFIYIINEYIQTYINTHSKVTLDSKDL